MRATVNSRNVAILGCGDPGSAFVKMGGQILVKGGHGPLISAPFIIRGCLHDEGMMKVHAARWTSAGSAVTELEDSQASCWS